MGSPTKLTIEPPRVGHETEGVANIVVDMLRAAPYRGDNNDFAFLCLLKWLWDLYRKLPNLQHT